MLPRLNAKELADLPVENPDEFNSSAFYFKKTNKLFLNYWLIYQSLRPFLHREKTLKILDIGTGVADLPVYLAKKLKQKHQNTFITGIDTNPLVIALAKTETKDYKNINVLCCGVGALRDTYDIAISSQMLHHLSPKESVDFLMATYSKINSALIISDLVRNRLVYWLVKLFIFFTTTNKITRHDGPMSVLRSYTNPEIKKLLQQAGIKNYKIRNLFFRKFIIIFKSEK